MNRLIDDTLSHPFTSLGRTIKISVNRLLVPSYRYLIHHSMPVPLRKIGKYIFT
ncbi:hypothetical protein [Lactiplantibacillus pentosus]|uniref:hypothetical protein n=1 Tax=Lactiplantibacillus pentosus TaxID=1589 RepID=UPI0021F080C0|nr:hypothetical protein [Lactiplantibacillus pentosus]